MKGFSIGQQNAGRDIVNISGDYLGIITIEFEDRQQDFLEWDVDLETGKVLDCRPFKAHVWCGFYVNEPDFLKIGDHVQVSELSFGRVSTQGFKLINYPILKITRK